MSKVRSGFECKFRPAEPNLYAHIYLTWFNTDHETRNVCPGCAVFWITCRVPKIIVVTFGVSWPHEATTISHPRAEQKAKRHISTFKTPCWFGKQEPRTSGGICARVDGIDMKDEKKKKEQ